MRFLPVGAYLIVKKWSRDVLIIPMAMLAIFTSGPWLEACWLQNLK